MIEIQTVQLNSAETEFSQMPDLLCDMCTHTHIYIYSHPKQTKKFHGLFPPILGIGKGLLCQLPKHFVAHCSCHISMPCCTLGINSTSIFCHIHHVCVPVQITLFFSKYKSTTLVIQCTDLIISIYHFGLYLGCVCVLLL